MCYYGFYQGDLFFFVHMHSNLFAKEVVGYRSEILCFTKDVLCFCFFVLRNSYFLLWASLRKSTVVSLLTGTYEFLLVKHRTYLEKQGFSLVAQNIYSVIHRISFEKHRVSSVKQDVIMNCTPRVG